MAKNDTNNSNNGVLVSPVLADTKVKGSGIKVFFTSYNPERGQTDSSPCTGASGQNQCELAKKGVRTIALDQGLVGRAKWKQFNYGDRVWLKSELNDDRCNGEFVVLDTMNARYSGKKRGDLFQLTRATNVSCSAVITKL